MTGATYVCGGEEGTARERQTDCRNEVHDWPEPVGYIDASVEADWRLKHGWSNVPCPWCPRYGWRPGNLTEQHVRRPA